jgi:hypothetical protein
MTHEWSMAADEWRGGWRHRSYDENDRRRLKPSSIRPLEIDVHRPIHATHAVPIATGRGPWYRSRRLHLSQESS